MNTAKIVRCSLLLSIAGSLVFLYVWSRRPVPALRAVVRYLGTTNTSAGVYCVFQFRNLGREPFTVKGVGHVTFMPPKRFFEHPHPRRFIPPAQLSQPMFPDARLESARDAVVLLAVPSTRPGHTSGWYAEFRLVGDSRRPPTLDFVERLLPALFQLPGPPSTSLMSPLLDTSGQVLREFVPDGKGGWRVRQPVVRENAG